MAKKAWTPKFTEAEEQSIDRLVKESKLSRDFVVWWLSTSGNTAMDFLARFGEKAGQRLQGIRQNEYVDKGYNAWQLERGATQEPTEGAATEAQAFGIGSKVDPLTDPMGYLVDMLSNQTQAEAEMMGMTATEYLEYLRGGGERPGGGLRQQADMSWELADVDAEADTSAVTGAVGDVFSALTPEQLDELGAQQISEKFGLQQLAVQEPEAFLQAMFDKAGISPSPPVYAFLRNMMPGIVLLASTREGQDILKSPGGAVELNKAINEVISQGFPSRESIMGGLQGMEGNLAREMLGGGYESGRGQFNFVMGTLDSLIGPTMAEPLRRALFSDQAAAQQGDRFLSASARGVYQGDFIDWLKDQGYPIPSLPAFKATPGAEASVAAAPFVEGEMGTSSSGAPFFPVKGGTYD